MPLRLIEITCSEANSEAVATVVTRYSPFSEWLATLEDGRQLLRVVVQSYDSEALLDELDILLGASDLDFRAVTLAVESTLPRRLAYEPQTQQENTDKAKRIAREELYHDLQEGTEASTLYFSQVALSAVVAAIGLVRNDTAVVIGAMVIAPLLIPNMALTMGVTLGDWSCVWKALKVNFAGLFLALGVALMFELGLDIDSEAPALVARSEARLLDVLLALAAGSAGALSITSGAPTALVGVMVAVALMPPLVAVGLLLGSGNYHMAIGAAELVAVNIIAINLSGVATFMLRGIRPRTWWEQERARTATRASLIAWVLLLVGLVTIIVLTGGD